MDKVYKKERKRLQILYGFYVFYEVNDY